MADGNAITVKIGAETDGVEQGLKKIQNSLGRLESASKESSKGFEASFGKIGLAAGVAGAAVAVGMKAISVATDAARAVVSGFGDAIALGGKLNDLSSSTGETAGNLLILQRAFENSGAGADKVGPAIAKMQKSIQDASEGSKEASDSLAMMGLTAGDLEGKLPNEQMQILAKGIQGIDDPTQRAAAAMGVFGRSGAQLLPLLTSMDGELGRAQDQLGSLPGVMDRSNAAFDRLSDNMGVISTKVRDFAAGFIEQALPALNAFTTALTGVDAAGWGQKMMAQVMAVADMLIGAFKSPGAAIDLLMSSLEAGIKTAGNNWLNSVLTVADVVQKVFGSDLPGLITSVVGNTLIKTFVDAAKALLDALNATIRAFETFLGDAISNIVSFFAKSFMGVVNAFAADFKAAMSDPIGFITGKLDSALAGVMENGGNAFQASFDSASGNVLDKVSAGLGAVSDEYGAKIVEGTAKIKDEFGRVIDTIEPSARDFFGATEATAKMKEDFNTLEENGKAIREKFTESKTEATSAKNELAAGANAADDIATAGKSFEGSVKSAAKELSASAKLMESIGKAREADAIDRGGRNAARAQAAIARGDFRGAERAARRIADSETEATLRGTGEGRDRRATADIGRDYGLRQQNGETGREFRQRILDARDGTSTAGKLGTSVPVDKPGQQGRTREEASKGSNKGTAKSPLETLVEDIKKLVEKIEPKLPVAALTA